MATKKIEETATATAPVVEIDRIAAETIEVPIIGTAPLIVHKFSEKAKKQMLDNMQGRKSPKTIKNPEEEFESSLYRTDDDGYGFPAVAFKAATIGAARYYGKDVKMVELKQVIFFHGEHSKSASQMLVRLNGEPIMREDYVRVGMNGTDLRYRGEFQDWSTVLRVTYVSSSLSRNSLLSLIDAGGLGGVGEWRPTSKKNSGEFGTYKIDTTKDIEVVS